MSKPIDGGNHPEIPSRRSFIKLLGIAAANMAASSSCSAQPSFAKSPFVLGVASGSPNTDGFVLWTRLIAPELVQNRSLDVNWEVFDIADPSKIVRRGQAPAAAALGYSVHVEVSDLQPDTWYGYRFTIDRFSSPAGRARTLPASDASPERLKIAFASCQRWEDGHYTAYQHMLSDEPDFVVFLGDYIYEYKSRTPDKATRTHSLPSAKTLDDYRARYALYKSDRALQAIHAACPWIMTWDDHEVENNYFGKHSMNSGQGFARRRLQAYQAYYEHMPLRSSAVIGQLTQQDPATELRLYGTYDFGRLARIYVLDNRQYREKPLCGKRKKTQSQSPCVEKLAENDPRSMLGTEQERWLDNALAESTHSQTIWNVLAQQTRFSPANYQAGPGKRANKDTWDGYPGSRRRILDALKRFRVSNPLFLGGDLHKAWVAHVHEAPYAQASAIIASEFVPSSISSRSRTSAAKAAKVKAANPHCLLFDPTRRGYGLLELRPQTATITISSLKSVQTTGPGITDRAIFEIESGNPAARRIE